jgi:coproporphyrinogen III oxidase-like Fe-S oxidoreductase
MGLSNFLRTRVKRLLLRRGTVTLEHKVPVLESRFQGIDEFGLYLHIPFCRQICPYCPYNKEIYHPEVAEGYVRAVKKEIDIYARLLGGRPVTSFYIGGGTPTTLLYSGLDSILQHVFASFNMQCGVHLESHPNDLSKANLSTISSLGVEHLSIGVEALQDWHLRTLHRPYTVTQVRAAVERAVSNGFQCVNADFIFALPGQTYAEVEQAGRALVEMGVDQIAAYPLFQFPYTAMGRAANGHNHDVGRIFRRRKMLSILERIFYAAGLERTSVWAFTRPGVPKYCSVTVPLYVGLGASGGSYLKDVFYLNTFNVQEYIRALDSGRLPIALSLELTEDMQMAGWLYWRLYETRFKKSDFQKRFGREFAEVYGRYIKPLSVAGLLTDKGDEIVLSDSGAYWLHLVQDLFSLEYVSRLWGTSKQEPWPEEVVL